MSKFANISHHSTDKWNTSQREAAQGFGEIHEMGFPNIPATWTREAVHAAAKALVSRLKTEGFSSCLIQGEMTFVVAFVDAAKKADIACYAACSERVSSEEILPDGSTRKVAHFQFVQFRSY